ncbi:MAG TPA: M48 family metalloprotease [Bacteriovoracaceae bacterium]|nr:M48 family metalloprotease [Bacteriovoracaceae bacterium]
MKMLILTLLLLGCAQKTSDRYREGDNTGQASALTVEEERQLSLEALKEMQKDYPPTKEKDLQAYIERIGNKLVKANNLDNNPYKYTFTVVDMNQVNAFALPAGTIFITIPIIAMADSEAEIAGVLGHEIGHVTARHTAERMYIQKKEQKKTWFLGGVGAAIGGTAGYFLGQKLCKPDDKECKAKYTLYGAGGGAAGGLLIQKYGFLKNSQEDELESDRVGFRYAVKAGYDKNKIGDFYNKLAKMEEESKKGQNALMGWLTDAMSTHPPSKSRVAQAKELRSSTPDNKGISSTSEFQQMKKKATAIMQSYSKK